MPNNIAFLQNWFKKQCNGDWEHVFGIHIETLDNPGWAVDIDLTDTSLQGVEMEFIKHERSEEDWIHCRIERDAEKQTCKFLGRGGHNNLEEILEVFTDLSKNAS